MIENLKYNKRTIAIIIRSNFVSKKTKFFTNSNSEFQIGSIVYKKNTEAKKHSHNKRNSTIKSTSEVLYIKKGKIIASIYNKKCTRLLFRKFLNKGDILFLNECGHSFKFVKDTQMIEIKQGPYLNLNDKKIF